MSCQMKRQQNSFLLTLLLTVIFFKDYSTGNKVFGKFGSVKVFLEVPYNIPLDNQWGRSWPEGIRFNDNFGGTPRSFQDGTLLPSAQQNTRRIAPVRRTYNWQAEELVISFNMTALANPTCTRLEPPITWLAASGARVKVLHSSSCSEESKFKAKVADQTRTSARCVIDTRTSVIEVSVARKFAESSLNVLRNNGFTRKDIYRMLDKGPWVLAFDIPAALPRLFTSLQTDLGFTQSQAVHIVSHCPYLIAQYARYKGRDVFATARALIDVGYTLPRLVTDVMRFPSMLAAPPDRIRGWMALLEGFGIAKKPALFGKMLKRAPFMLYVNPPKIGDEDLSQVVVSDISTTASGFVAYEALKVLQLLKSQNFPDLDKIIRTQPSILLVDTDEVIARANFLFNLFLENMPSASTIGKPDSDGADGTVVRTNSFKNDNSVTDFNRKLVEEFENRNNNSSNRDRREAFRSISSLVSKDNTNLDDEFDEFVLKQIEDNRSALESKSKNITTYQRVLSTADTANTMAVFIDSDDVDGSMSERNDVDNDIDSNRFIKPEQAEIENTNTDTVVPLEPQYTSEIRDSLVTDSQNPNRNIAQEMLGALLLTYPAVLSIDHQQMRAAGNALREAGLRRGEVLLIARRHPPVLGRDPTLLINLINFLRYTCGLHKADLLPFLYRYPAVLGAEVKDIEPKVEYLFQSLGGSQEMLRRFPSFLSFDLEAHTRPRAEFLRALKIDPLMNGLAFLVNAPAKEIAYTAGVRVELFNQFQIAYSEMWKKKALKEKENCTDVVSSNGKDTKNGVIQLPSWMIKDTSPQEILLDELDFSF